MLLLIFGDELKNTGIKVVPLVVTDKKVKAWIKDAEVIRSQEKK